MARDTQQPMDRRMTGSCLVRSYQQIPGLKWTTSYDSL